MTDSEAIAPNSRAALERRRAAGVLTWRGPAVMLFARSGFAVAAQGLVAAILLMEGSASPWRDAGAWLPVYGTLIDAGCICLLWWLMRRESLALADLFGFARGRLVRDLLLGVALVLASLAFILAGVSAGSLLIYGDIGLPQFGAPLPFPAALYAVLVWPLIWGLVEQMTYNGYLLPRIRVLSASMVVAVAAVTFSWSFQHVVMPLSLDPHYMLHRLLASVPNSLFMIFMYLRLRRILPLAIAHALMNGAAMFVGSLWPLLQ